MYNVKFETMSNLIRLVYSSTAVRPMTQQDLQDLLVQVREKNYRLQITGMLLYQKQTFLQVLEGAQKNVEGIFKAIARDQRHREVTLLLKNPIEEREYSSWDMKFTNLDALDQGKIPGFSADSKDSLDFRHFEMNNFTYTCLCIFRSSE